MLENLLDMEHYKYGMYNEFEILDYLVNDGGFHFLIYGVGENGRFLLDWCRKIYKIDPKFFVDKTPKCSLYDGIRVLSLVEFEHEVHRGGNYIAVVSPYCYKDDLEEHRKIHDYLTKNRVKMIIDGNCVLEPYKRGWYPEYFREQLSAFEKTYEKLVDDVSRDTFVRYLKTYITGGRYDGITFPEKYKYWGIDDESDRMFHLTEQEVLLNVGACCGDTVFQYLKCKNPFHKIIAVEPVNQEQLKCAVSCLNPEVKSKIQIDEFFLGEDGNTIDNLYADENLSLINMDIEGGEMKVLQSGVQTIKKCRPILAICVYHKRDDLIQIPEFISRSFDNYVFALRKYPSAYFLYFDGIQQINELVLYAIPAERYCK